MLDLSGRTSVSRVGVIDIGTNSVKMVVGKRSHAGDITLVAKGREVTRLGQGLAASGRIAPEAMERTVEALARLAERARVFGATQIAAVGTQALREAENGNEFLAAAREQAGVSVEIITGKREAALAYAAVQRDPTLALREDVPLLVFDIGGGSSELVCGQANSIDRSISLPMGAVRMTERFLKTDPPTDAEYEDARRRAERQIAVVHGFPRQPLQLAGIGGTVVNAASVALGGSGEIHGTELSERQVDHVARLLRSMPLVDRRRVPGLETARADIILGGIAILQALLGVFQADGFVVSTRGIRYALLWELLGEE